MATDAQRNSCQVRTLTSSYTRPKWLGSLGHVNGEQHSYSYPGGCDQFSCTLAVQATDRNEALNPGRILEVWKGAKRIWEGVLDEPVPNTTGWSITAHGNATYGSSLMAIYATRSGTADTCTVSNGSPVVSDTNCVSSDVGSIITGQGIVSFPPTVINSVTAGSSFVMSQNATWSGVTYPTFYSWSLDQVLNNAISRGLRWTKPTFGNQGWMQSLQDSGSTTVTDFLNNATIQAGLLWYVDVQQNNLLTIASPPSTVNRLLVCQVPNARTMGAMLNSLYYKYVSSTTGSLQGYTVGNVSNAASKTQFGVQEQYLDMTNAGLMTSGAAQANAQAILNQYITAMFSQTYTVRAGQLLTTGGSPVDPSIEPAGNVYRLLLTDGSYGGQVVAGPVTFVGGEVEWDDDSLTAQITPYQSYKTNLQTLLTKQMPHVRM